MAQAFLDRFYAEVASCLGDPAFTARYPKSQRLSHFYEIEAQLWERIRNACGQESMPGRTDVTITLVSGQEFYPLPGNFSSWTCLYNSNGVILPTIQEYEDGPGVRLFERPRGFAVRPVPTSGLAGAWTLEYQRGPILLHNATATLFAWANLSAVAATKILTDDDAGGAFASWMEGCRIILSGGTGFTAGTYTIDSVTDADNVVLTEAPCATTASGGAGTIGDAIDLGTPATDEGEKIVLDDYYNGSVIRLYSATTGVPQEFEITDHDATLDIVKFRHPMLQVPTGTLLYEICPILPEKYDGLYAMDVAIRASTNRAQWTRGREFERRRRELWNGALNYFADMTKDRPPQRILLPWRHEGVDPYAWQG